MVSAGDHLGFGLYFIFKGDHPSTTVAKFVSNWHSRGEDPDGTMLNYGPCWQPSWIGNRPERHNF